MPLNSADPWIIFHGGTYFSSESRRRREIWIRKSRTIVGISLDPGVCVWTAPRCGGNADHIWAPELHLLDGKWFIYYAADDGRNENRRMWVLESEGADPCGRYRSRGRLETGGWAVDGTVMTLADGRRYLLWSGRPGRRSHQQNLYLAPMRSPASLSGCRVLLASPDRAWERVAMPICEGPQVLLRNGDIFILYSASGSWTPECCLGLLHNQSGDVLKPAAWSKHGPVFRKTDQVWGVGHCSLVKSLGQSEDWLIYRSKSSAQPDWVDRGVQARPFAWASDGFPDFGIPAPRTSLFIPDPTRFRARAARLAN